MRAHLRQFYLNRLRRTPHELILNQQTIGSRAMVFAPHPDDETLGCGGAILKMVRAGVEVKVIFLTDGATSHSHLMAPAALSALRAQEALAATRALGVPAENVCLGRFADGRLSEQQAVAQAKVTELLYAWQPSAIFLPYRREPPTDHRAANKIVIAAAKTCQLSATYYEYPVWAWYHWPWVALKADSQRGLWALYRNTFAAAGGLRLLKDFQHRLFVGDILAEKSAALAEHRSQMTRLQPDERWLTLADMAQGEWLRYSLQPYEFYCVRGQYNDAC